jgi:glycosyltransferase involved in cell wall biosynthesis
MAKVSLVLCTARDDYPMIDLPDTHLFQPTLDSLERQTFQDFELVVSDCRYEHRPCFKDNEFRGHRYDFPIKHVPVKPYSPWLQRGMWGGACARNRGIIAADDDCELLIFLDDCCEFNPDFIELYWKWYQKGYFAMALAIYHKGGELVYTKQLSRAERLDPRGMDWYKDPDLARKIFTEDEPIRDSRWRYVENAPNGVLRVNGDLYYGYSSCSMEAILRVNGWDENFDGDKSLADVDLGWRLEMAGYRDFILDRRLIVVENFHHPIPRDTIWYEGRPVRQNYNLMVLNRRKGRYRANSYQLTEEDLNFVRRLAWMDPKVPKDVPIYQPEDPEYELQRWWFENPPVFDLRELRLES